MMYFLCPPLLLTDHMCSLSLVNSSICADREHLLREHVGVKMSLGTLYKDSGLVASMDPE